MRRSVLLGASLAAFLAGVARALAQESTCTVTDGGSLKWVVPARPDTPTVDGKLAEWSFAKPAVVANKQTICEERMGWREPGPQGDDDLSAVVQVAWDRDCVYLAARVRDDQLAETSGQKRWGSPWGHDSVVVLFRPPAWLTRGPRAVGWAPEAMHLGLSYYSVGDEPRPLPGGCRYVAAKTENGYAVEAAVPFDVLGFRPAAGDRVPFMLIFSDIDPDKAPHLRFDQYGVPTRGFGPSQMAQMRLLCEAGYGVDLVAGRERIKPGGSVQFCGTIDVVGKPMGLLGVDVVSVEDRKALWRIDFRWRLAVGRRYDVSGTFAAPANAETGDYVLRMVFEE